MIEMKINKKGQITVPKSIRDKYGWAPGVSFKIIDDKGKISVEPEFFCHRCGKVLSKGSEQYYCSDCDSVPVFCIY